VAKDQDEVAKLVLRYAPAALREVDELAGTDALKRARRTDNLNVGLLIRQKEGGQAGPHHRICHRPTQGLHFLPGREGAEDGPAARVDVSETGTHQPGP
jgi:hypothetical protein